MKTTQGKCKFCGQYRVINVPDNFNQAEVDLEAEKKCDCPESVAHTKIEENIAYTEQTIKEFFLEKDGIEVIRDLLLQATRPLAEGKISNISVKKGGYTGSMKPSKEGIKITLKYTTEESVES